MALLPCPAALASCGDDQAGGTARDPSPSPSTFTMSVLSQILAAPAQNNTSDGTGQLITDGKRGLLLGPCPEECEEQDKRREHSQLTPVQPFAFAAPGLFFPGYLLCNAQSPQRPAQSSPLPRICRSLIPKPGH